MSQCNMRMRLSPYLFFSFLSLFLGRWCYSQHCTVAQVSSSTVNYDLDGLAGTVYDNLRRDTTGNTNIFFLQFFGSVGKKNVFLISAGKNDTIITAMAVGKDSFTLIKTNKSVSPAAAIPPEGIGQQFYVAACEETTTHISSLLVIANPMKKIWIELDCVNEDARYITMGNHNEAYINNALALLATVFGKRLRP